MRKIYKKDDGSWWVKTVVGGGALKPAVGQWVAADQISFGPMGRFSVSKNGSRAYYSSWGGIYKVSLTENLATLIKSLPDGLNDWHVGGCYLTSDSVFYWAPGGDKLCRYTDATGQWEYVSNAKRGGSGYTGYIKDAGLVTALVAYAPEASAIFWGGGDQENICRLMDDTVKVLTPGGTWSLNSSSNWSVGNPKFGNSDGCLYGVYIPYAWPQWILRFKFKDSGTNVEGVPAKMARPDFGCVPNPFSSQVFLTMRGQGATPAFVRIYDESGRLVREINAWHSADRAIIWDGKDAMDKEVASGRYVVRMLNASGKTTSGTLTLLR